MWKILKNEKKKSKKKKKKFWKEKKKNEGAWTTFQSWLRWQKELKLKVLTTSSVNVYSQNK